MTDKVVTERDADVLVILIHNPPINAESFDVRRGILDAIEVLAGDASRGDLTARSSSVESR